MEKEASLSVPLVRLAHLGKLGRDTAGSYDSPAERHVGWLWVIDMSR